MAKAKTKKLTRGEPAAEPQNKLMDPKALHELLGIVGPYEPPPAPIPTKGYVTWWDCGMSVQTLAKKQPKLFSRPAALEGERYAKDSDSWKWRQWRIEPIEPGLPFAEQQKQLKTGDEPAAVRELTVYLALVFLTTGERLDLGRLRCKDVLPNGQRMTVWLSPMGFDFASVSDLWKSPGIGLSVMSTPAVARKK
jgi:hypothetical protein